MAFKIYTKTGDKGDTGLLGGTRVPKHHARIETYGTVDELNSHIGLVGDLVQDEGSKITLRYVQDRLFTIGSLLATDPQKNPGVATPDIVQEDILRLELQMDAMDEVLPEMRHFILPGGHATVSQIHIARCVCRRAERRCVELDHHGGEVDPLIIIYLNRLSDYLFVLSRYQSHLLSVTEVAWKPRG